VYQSPVAGNWQTTPLVVDGMMYITQRLNDVVALDAATGRAFWIYRYTPAQDRVVCCGANNRGLGILGDTLFMGTLDAQLIAIDRRTGRVIWKTEVATTKSGYSITHAPLVVKNKVIVGVGGGEYGIRGFIAAYDVTTGREAWRFYNVLYYPYVRELSRKSALAEARRLSEARRRNGQRDPGELEQVLAWLADVDEDTFYKWQRRASDMIAAILWEENGKIARDAGA